MFRGKISAKINRYGQETTQHIRPLTREDRKLLGRRYNGANALREVVDAKTGLTYRFQELVHPDTLK